MGTGNKHDGSPKSVRVPSPYAVWGGRLAPVLGPIAVRANGSTGTMCCVRSREAGNVWLCWYM